MSKKLKYVKLFDGFFIPGVNSNMGDQLPSASKNLKDFEMELEDNGTISLSWTGPAGAKEQFVLGVSMWKCAKPV